MASLDVSSLIPKRYILAFLIFWGFFTMYGLRVNINVAIGAMTKERAIVVNGKEVVQEPEFDWSSRLKGVILGSFYYGYIALQIPGGWLAMKIGATRLYGMAILVASLLTLLTPIAARTSVHFLIVLRILEGLVLGVMFPCNHAIWSKWAPAMERATLLTIGITGCTVGSVASMPISGILSKYGFDGGWGSVFYCFGLFGVLWYIMWFMLAYETPSVHPSITKEERAFIEKTAVHASEMKGGVPWKSLLGSKRVWGIVIGAFASDWGLYVLLICVPLYLLDVIHYDVQQMGFVAATPFLLKSISCPVGGYVADFLRRREYLRTITIRRLFYSMGATASVFIVLSGYIEDPVMVVVTVGIAGLVTGLIYSGFQVNMLDISPRNASITMGLCNTVGGTTGFITPMLVGFMTRNKTAREWRVVFWITFVVYVVGAVMFCLLVSVDRQEWDKPDRIDTDKDTDLKSQDNDKPVTKGREEVVLDQD